MSRRLVVEAEPAFRTEAANPYNANLYRAMDDREVRVQDFSYRRLLLNRVDIVHLHWPELTFLSGHRTSIHAARLVFFHLFLRVARLRGTKLFWTVHNVAPHEQRSTARLRALHRRLLTRHVDAIFALTADGLAAAREAYPEIVDVPGFVTPHGHYRDDYDFSTDRADARRRLGVDDDARLVLAVGQIRPYRNIPHLIEVFGKVDGEDLVLCVAGSVAPPELGDTVRAAAQDDERVRVELAFLPNDRLALWLRAADLVALPYTAIQNSGSAILGLSAGRPVLVPDLGAMREVAELVGPQWVRLFSGELDAVDLQDAVSWATDERSPAPDLSPLDWASIAAATVRAYREVLDR